MWFKRQRDEDRRKEQESRELLDQYHPRASVTDGERMLVDPGKVLENIAFSMERVDTDINTPISIEEDVVTIDVLYNLIEVLKMGPLLAVHVVNNALRIMDSRYPAELVHHPLPRDYDLRKIGPLKLSDREHDTAKSIFNLRSTRESDITEADIASEFTDLDVPEQMSIFVALYYMFGGKVGALKHRTGIE